MPQRKRGNAKVRQACANIQPTITEYDQKHSGDEETAVTDILGDLMLWCYAGNVDFDEHLKRALRHFAVESDPHFRSE